tara:strand:- start:567 stop:773 length:207 start_codon:yes stop_codon:yes gene_type:complete
LYKNKFVKNINDKKLTIRKIMNIVMNEFSKMLKLLIPLLIISVTRLNRNARMNEYKNNCNLILVFEFI